MLVSPPLEYKRWKSHLFCFLLAVAASVVQAYTIDEVSFEVEDCDFSEFLIRFKRAQTMHTDIWWVDSIRVPCQPLHSPPVFLALLRGWICEHRLTARP